jgi:calmodulin
MAELPREDNEPLFRVFTRFDKDENGLIDEREFLEILLALGESPSKAVLSLEFAAIDTNSDGMVEFREFKAWWHDYR